MYRQMPPQPVDLSTVWYYSVLGATKSATYFFCSSVVPVLFSARAYMELREDVRYASQEEGQEDGREESEEGRLQSVERAVRPTSGRAIFECAQADREPRNQAGQNPGVQGQQYVSYQAAGLRGVLSCGPRAARSVTTQKNGATSLPVESWGNNAATTRWTSGRICAGIYGFD